MKTITQEEKEVKAEKFVACLMASIKDQPITQILAILKVTRSVIRDKSIEHHHKLPHIAVVLGSQQFETLDKILRIEFSGKNKFIPWVEVGVYLHGMIDHANATISYIQGNGPERFAIPGIVAHYKQVVTHISVPATPAQIEELSKKFPTKAENNKQHVENS
jgi:hypothetical protein